MKKACTLLLQRNLPDVTNEFAKNLLQHNGDLTDFYVIESGSDKENLTEHPSFHADWKDAQINGLRVGRGFNFGLKSLVDEKLDYPYVMMTTGDTYLPEEPIIDILINELEANPKIGIISPITWNWGARVSGFKGHEVTKAMSMQLPHICWMFRRECLQDLTSDRDANVYGEYLYDGTNFRGYGIDTEVMIRAYQNNWMFAVTSKVSHQEDYHLTDRNFEVMKTDTHNKHRELMWTEGLEWLKRKYNFDNKFQLINLLQFEYMSFFNRHPDLKHMMC